jgi:hypothetical protein
VVKEAGINKIIRLIGDLEATLNKPFNRFTDTLTTDAIELNFNYVFHVSLYRRLSYHGPPGKICHSRFKLYSRPLQQAARAADPGFSA